jgi:hypothetical protein
LSAKNAAESTSPARDRLLVAALAVYVAILGIGTAGVLFDLDWILRLF